MYMKVAQNNETNPDTEPVRPPHIPSIANLQYFTSDSSVRKRETPGILSRMFPPFTGTTTHRVRAHLASRFVMSCIIMHLLHCIYCFFPLFSLVDYETDAAAGAPTDYAVDDPSFSAELPGKPPPLITRYHLFLLYTACIRVV